MAPKALEARQLLQETLADLQTREIDLIARFKCAHDCMAIQDHPTEHVHAALCAGNSDAAPPTTMFRNSAFCVDFVVKLPSQQLFVVEYDAVTVFQAIKFGDRWSDPALETLKCETRGDWFRKHLIPVLRIGHCVDPDSYRSIIWNFIRLLQRYVDPPNSMFLLKTVGDCYEGDSGIAKNSITAQVHLARELARLRRAGGGGGGNTIEIFRQHPANNAGLSWPPKQQYPSFSRGGLSHCFDFMVVVTPDGSGKIDSPGNFPPRRAMIDVVSVDWPHNEFKEFFCQKHNIPWLLWHFEHGPVQPHLGNFLREVAESPEGFIWRR